MDIGDLRYLPVWLLAAFGLYKGAKWAISVFVPLLKTERTLQESIVKASMDSAKASKSRAEEYKLAFAEQKELRQQDAEKYAAAMRDAQLRVALMKANGDQILTIVGETPNPFCEHLRLHAHHSIRILQALHPFMLARVARESNVTIERALEIRDTVLAAAPDYINGEDTDLQLEMADGEGPVLLVAAHHAISTAIAIDASFAATAIMAAVKSITSDDSYQPDTPNAELEEESKVIAEITQSAKSAALAMLSGDDESYDGPNPFNIIKRE